MVADVFMSAIEAVTAVKKMVKQKVDGETRLYRVSVWNATVANLTLMALGSSAPEILLSMIELVFSNGFKSGELGPSTIVGSAAFNLMVIIAVCVIAIPATETRRIDQMRVYMVTAFFSVFAYVWLIIILLWSSPNMIEPWEAIATLLMFPFLVALAFVMDKSADPGWLKQHPLTLSLIKCCLPRESEDELPSSYLLDVKHADGSPLTGGELAKLVRHLGPGLRAKGYSESDAMRAILKKLEVSQPRSRAYHRINTTRKLMGLKPLAEGKSPAEAAPHDLELASGVRAAAAGAACTIQFAASAYADVEGCGTLAIQLTRTGDVSRAASVMLETVDGSAAAGADYVAICERVEFAAGQETVEIRIEIIDDDVEEDDEQFAVRIYEPSAGAALGAVSRTLITIINDDLPGIFTFVEEEVSAVHSAECAVVSVRRQHGCSGAVAFSWRTLDGSVRAGEDFAGSAGRLSWEHGDVSTKEISVPLIPNSERGTGYFDVEITDAEGGAKFDALTDGSAERSLARVNIVDDQATRSLLKRTLASLDGYGISGKALATGREDWSAQFAEAFTLGFDDDAGALEKALAYLSLPWKILFSIIPPTSYCHGWLCFTVSIIVIGLVTAVIGDLASLLGCTINLKKSVVAITFVALGTSVPDTFASKAAASADPTADAAIGNVTGSNSVNVFLGLGISWVIGALYWTSVGATPEWIEQYSEIATFYNIQPGQAVGLAVPAGDLAFSVLVFFFTAVVTLGTLYYRRRQYGAELGGRGRWPTFALLIFLWLLYVTLSTMRAYGALG